MSTLLMSSNLVEPFFSSATDSKDYLHSFSESILNFGPSLSGEMNVVSAMGPANPVNHLHHYHLGTHQGSPNALSGIVKFEEDNHFEEFYPHSLCSPCLVDEYNMDLENGWTNKSPDQWQPVEVAEWIRNWARRNEIQDIEVAHLLYNQMSGSDLCQMQREYFTSVCPQYGNLIFDSLQSLLNQFRSQSSAYMSFSATNGCISSQGEPMHPCAMNGGGHAVGNGMFVGTGVSECHQGTTVEFFPHISNLEPLPNALFDVPATTQLDYSPTYTSVSDSDRESTSSNLSGLNERRIPIQPYYSQVCVNSSVELIDTVRPTAATIASKSNPLSVSIKRNGRRGRPPKKEAKSRSKGNGKLWEFIRDLLLNPITNPSLIRWERREDGIFKFIQSDKVAKMWGERKQNPRMTYEKLSRAMRYYYKSQVLLPVFGRRLVYKFGPNATGWRPQFDMKPPSAFLTDN